MTRARDLADYISTGVSDTELDVLDGVTAGTVTASKALVVDANKDVASLRNATLTGTATINTLAVDGGTIKLDGNYPTGTGNVALGDTALDSVQSGGDNNVAIGHNAGTAVTTGTRNVLLGAFAGDAFIDANRNIAIGYNAIGADTKGSRAVGIGYGALQTQNHATSTDNYNVAVGYNAGGDISTGVENTLIGALAGDSLRYFRK